MILADSDIIKYAERGMIRPFDRRYVNPASYDLTLSNELIEITAGGIIDASSRDNFTSQRKIVLQAGQRYLLQPGTFILASSLEYVTIPPELAAEVKLKSTTARKGIGHVYSGWIDPGFQGQITFELFSHIPVYLEPGKPVAQIIFLKMLTVPDKLYDGKYQGQLGPTLARTEQLEMFGPAKVVDKLLELDRKALDYWFSKSKTENFSGLEDAISTGHVVADMGMDSLTLRVKEDFSDSFDERGYPQADAWEDDTEPGIL